jgi:hypothetical protein
MCALTAEISFYSRRIICLRCCIKLDSAWVRASFRKESEYIFPSLLDTGSKPFAQFKHLLALCMSNSLHPNHFGRSGRLRKAALCYSRCRRRRKHRIKRRRQQCARMLGELCKEGQGPMPCTRIERHSFKRASNRRSFVFLVKFQQETQVFAR